MAEVQIESTGIRTSAIPEIAQTGGGAGRSSKRRQEAVRDLVRQMRADTRKGPEGRWEGPLRPCTVVNFNPVELVVEGQIRLTVPKAGATEKHQVRLLHRGRNLVGQYCYIASPQMGEMKPDKEPVFYTSVTGHVKDSVLGIDVPDAEARVFTPQSIACELVAQYNSWDTKLMGGILVFDQDPHTLSETNLERSGGRIWVPVREQLTGSFRYSYHLRESTLVEELDRVLEVQRQYCDMILQYAHAWFVDEDTNSRKLITDTHREWARYALKMGYLTSLPAWVTARLAVAGDVANLVACKYCGKQQPRADVFFCPQCRAPFDPMRALEAGLVVPVAFLEMLEGEDLKKARAILSQRRRKFATIVPRDEQDEREPEENTPGDGEPAEGEQPQGSGRRKRGK